MIQRLSAASALAGILLAAPLTVLLEQPALSRQAKTFEVVDVEKVKSGDPSSGIKQFQLVQPSKIVYTDVLIAGGGMGGLAAAIAASRSGEGASLPPLRVCLTEETSWLGGQMTTQGVSALDENYLVETTGATATYQGLRKSIRDYYRSNYQLHAEQKEDPYLNPGRCWVSRLSFEPKVAMEKIDELTKPLVESGALSIFTRLKAVSVDMGGRAHVKSVLMVNLDSGEFVEFRPRIVLDATELGDLLPMAKYPYRTGSESHSVTKEAHAPEKGDPENVQDFVYPFVLEFRTGENHLIEKPAHYDDFLTAGKFSFQGYKMFDSAPAAESEGSQSTYLPFWEYRRLLDKTIFTDGKIKFDVALINWDSNDLRGENIVDKPALIMAERLALAKSLSLGFLYWLQTEAQRDDGGKGYPELFLRRDVLGTEDGLSKYPYIREARRIQAHKQILEHQIVAATTEGARAIPFSDSAGIGLYPVDIHGKQDVPGAGQPTRPFQIPLSALLPSKGGNLLPACKNIGTTHVTNGAYRLHPVEWAIGEAQGSLCRIAVDRKMTPHHILHDKKAMRLFQNYLLQNGIPIYWFDDLDPNSETFRAAQFLAVTQILPAEPYHLHFRPDDPITLGEAAQAISTLLHIRHNPELDDELASLAACVNKKLFTQEVTTNSDPNGRLPASEWEALKENRALQLPGETGPISASESEPVTRADFALWLYKLATEDRHIGRV